MNACLRRLITKSHYLTVLYVWLLFRLRSHRA